MLGSFYHVYGIILLLEKEFCLRTRAFWSSYEKYVNFSWLAYIPWTQVLGRKMMLWSSIWDLVVQGPNYVWNSTRLVAANDVQRYRVILSVSCLQVNANVAVISHLRFSLQRSDPSYSFVFMNVIIFSIKFCKPSHVKTEKLRHRDQFQVPLCAHSLILKGFILVASEPLWNCVSSFSVFSVLLGSSWSSWGM